MLDTEAGYGLLAAVLLFVAFLVVKSRFSLRPVSPAVAAARKRLKDAKATARRAADDEGKARAWLTAAAIARDELGRPRLAASYALRAARVAPDHVEAIALMSAAFREAKKHRTLERFLWRRLDGAPGPGYDRAFEELVSLYDGPLRRRERAEALRQLKARASSA